VLFEQEEIKWIGPTDWSRDGQWLYFSSDRNGSRNIWRVSLSGGPAKQITTGGAFLAVMSPDGTEVFYAPGPIGSPLLAVSASGGAKPREVLNCTNGFATSTTALYYIDCVADPRVNAIGSVVPPHVYAVRIHEGTAPASRRDDRVIGRTRTIGRISSLTVSPDGKTVLVPRTTTLTKDLVLIENFR